MKPFKKITIKNYRCYENETFDLSNNLTILYGESDNGKSTVINALLSVVNNVISDEDIMHGKTTTSIALTLEDGWEVIREKSNTSINRYIINDPDGNEYERYDNFGIYIPSEVNAALGRELIEALEDIGVTLNFSEQLKLSMVLSLKNYQLAKMIDELSNISIFNKSIEKANSEISSSQREKSSLLKQNEKLKNKVDNLKPVLELEEKYNKLSERFLILKNKTKKLDTLQILNSKKETVVSSIRKEKEIVKQLKILETLKKDANLLELKEKKYNTFKRLNGRISDITTQANILKDNIENLKQLKDLKIDEVIAKNKEIKELIKYHTNYSRIKIELEKNNKLVKEKDKLQMLLKNINSLEKKRAIFVQMNLLFKKNTQTSRDLNINKQKSNSLKSLENKLEKIDKLSIKKKQYVNMLTINEKYKSIKNTLIVNEKSKTEALNNYQNLKEKYRITLRNMEICPVCNGPIDKQHIEKIVNNV